MKAKYGRPRRPVHRCALDIVLPAGLARVTKAARG